MIDWEGARAAAQKWVVAAIATLDREREERLRDPVFCRAEVARLEAEVATLKAQRETNAPLVQMAKDTALWLHLHGWDIARYGWSVGEDATRKETNE